MATQIRKMPSFLDGLNLYNAADRLEKNEAVAASLGGANSSTTPVDCWRSWLDFT